MALANGSFETAGSRSYDAASWTVATVVAANEGAYLFETFAVDAEDTVADTAEVFSYGWGDVFLPAFVGFYTDLTYGFMDSPLDPKTDEDFEDLWGAGPARISSANGPFVLANGMTLRVSVDGAPYQAIGFLATQFEDITDARPEEVMHAINAAVPVGFVAALVGATVQLRSTRVGLAATLQVVGGTAQSPLGYSGTAAAGTADGSPFLHSVEFGLEDDGGYESWWINSLELDAPDVTDRYGPLATDPLGWYTLDTAPDYSDFPSRFSEYARDNFNLGWA